MASNIDLLGRVTKITYPELTQDLEVNFVVTEVVYAVLVDAKGEPDVFVEETMEGSIYLTYVPPPIEEEQPKNDTVNET